MINKVSQIYDSLFSFEKAKNGEGNGYPIHKKLVFTAPDIKDIYHWVLSKFDFSSSKEILDAGCGVGYGSLLLAKHTSAKVTGISISKAEIQQAQSNAIHQKLAKQTEFLIAQFAEAPDRGYDFIIAIESLKHSFNLEASLKELIRKLKSGGTLIIIEDFYQATRPCEMSQKYCQDWALVKAYQLSDYQRHLSNTNFIDLTMKMPVKDPFWLVIQQWMLTFLHFLNQRNASNIYKIFRGGIYLDRLYVQKKMKYGCLLFVKPQDDA